jgi:hypothetical protein
MRVYGTVRDAKDEKAIQGAKVRLSVGDKELAVLSTDNDGKFELRVEESYVGKTLVCRAEKKKYRLREVSVAIKKEEVTMDIELDPVEEDKPPTPSKNGKWSKIAFGVAGLAVVLAVVAVLLVLLQEKAPPSPPPSPPLQIKVWTKTIALKNGGRDRAAAWTADYPGIFSEVYNAFAVMQGFSLWNNNGQTAFSHYGHTQGLGAWTQHVYVRVIGFDANRAWGEVYCQEGNVGVEPDNTVLFTVVVIGHK